MFQAPVDTANKRVDTWQLLQGYIMHHLIVSSLDEGGIDGADGDESFTCQACCKCDGMLLCDTHIKDTVWEALFKPGSRVGRQGSEVEVLAILVVCILQSSLLRLQLLCTHEGKSIKV
jgi:hypothetical protein